MLALALTLALLSASASSNAKHDFADGKAVFEKTLKTLLDDYVDDLTADDLYRGAVQGMLAHAGDRAWDTLLSPDEMGDINGALAGHVVGIGVQVKFDSDAGMARVIDVIPGSAAEKAHVAVGDQILKV